MINYSEEFTDAYAELEKAIKDRSHLVPKIITDKNGHQRKVMVRPDEQKKNKRVKHTENSNDEIINRLEENIKNKNFGTIGKSPAEYLNKLKSYVEKNGVSSYEKVTKEQYINAIEKLQKKYPVTEEDKKRQETEKLNKLPDNFYSYSKDTQNNIKNAKYSIVSAKYTSDSGKITEHKIAVAMIPSEFNSFDNAEDVVKRSILYGTYGSGGKKEITSIENVSPYDFEKITGKKVGDYANQAAERDYSYVSLKNDMVAAVQKEDEEDMKKSYSESFADAFDELQKAIKDRSHLTQKVITDKNGHTRKVWVKTEEKKSVKPGKNVADDSSLLPSWTIEEEKTLDADAKSLDNEIKRIKNISYSEREEYRDLFINHLFNYSYAIQDYANDRTITNDILPSERDFNYDDVSFEKLFEMADKMNSTVKKLKAQKRSEARQQKEKMDAVNKLMAEDKSNDNFIEKLHRAEEKYNSMKKNIKR